MKISKISKLRVNSTDGFVPFAWKNIIKKYISLCDYSPGVWNNKDIWGGCGGVGVEIWYHITRSRNIFKSKKRNFSSGWMLLDSSCRYLLFAQNQMSSVSRIQKNLEIIYVHSCDINLNQDGPSSGVKLILFNF